VFFSITLYISVAIFLLSLVYKVFTWFRYKTSIESKNFSALERMTSTINGMIKTVFSEKIIVLARVFVLDILFQGRLLKVDPLRWVAHMFMFFGFTLLLLMHGLDSIITETLFRNYYSTVNPFMFLRDLFGFMAIIGVGMAIYRRIKVKPLRFRNNSMDIYTIVIFAVVMVSGIFLEGAKIASYDRYQEMVSEWTDDLNETEQRALESVWAKDFGVVSPTIKTPFDQDLLQAGFEIHEVNCAACHSRPQYAFLGYATAKIINPVARNMEKAGLPNILWTVHFLACFVGLAYLPFSKLFHIIASPLCLMCNAVMKNSQHSDRASLATKQAFELDVCTHCGLCTSRCSVGIAVEVIHNQNILPSEKLGALKRWVSGKITSREDLQALLEGTYLCTNCDRCTEVCPVGINLKDLWVSVRENLFQAAAPEPLALSPFSFVRGLLREEIDQGNYQNPVSLTKQALTDGLKQETLTDLSALPQPVKEFKRTVSLSQDAKTYSACFGCETCTSVCPVVANYENPVEVLGLLPHQIMHSIGLGLKDLVFASRMPWDCLTCYLCQEHCPQRVQITEVLYEIKQLAVEQRRHQLAADGADKPG
jgi:heterodisulfide reductase subunit C